MTERAKMVKRVGYRLILTEQKREWYLQVLETLVRGACKELYD